MSASDHRATSWTASAYSEKAAETDHPIEVILGGRWSPRAFSGRPVEKEKLLSLFEAARWAPSSNNAQPWSFVVATANDPVEHGRMLGILKEGNRKWAYRAPVLILSVAGVEAEDGSALLTAHHDLGLAVGNLVAQATALGLSVHQMAGFDRDAARETYRIPPGHEPVAVIALGYIGDPAMLPDYLREREAAPRVRKSQEEFVFSGGWNELWDRRPNYTDGSTAREE